MAHQDPSRVRILPPPPLANDRVFGGDGRDLLRAGRGGDSLWGQGDNDRLFGGRTGATL
jgi:Ca2+-binding RTX toxin-like protein